MAGSSGFLNVNNGDVTGNHGNYDFWITKLSPSGSLTGNLTDDQSIQGKPLAGLKISPNPAISFLSIGFNALQEPVFFKRH